MSLFVGVAGIKTNWIFYSLLLSKCLFECWNEVNLMENAGVAGKTSEPNKLKNMEIVLFSAFLLRSATIHSYSPTTIP
jgi:hypothetical protein